MNIKISNTKFDDDLRSKFCSRREEVLKIGI